MIQHDNCFRISTLLAGLSPLPFHLGNLFLHTTTVTLLYLTCRDNLGLSAVPAFTAAAAFATHPVLSEAVSAV